MVALLWPVGPTTPIPQGDEVHVWSGQLERTPDEIEKLARTLTTDEQERARRFVIGAARDQFVVARGLLRTLLARYLCCEPGELRFGATGLGKPVLASPTHLPLHFNVSHSRELALFAVSVRGEVGVDVEQCRPYPNYHDMARRFFTEAEASGLRALPSRQAEAAFFHVWTCKEAFLKLTGLGLSHGLERFEVSVQPPARLLRLDGQTAPAQRYSLESFNPAADYTGALAVEGSGYQLRCWALL